jgi:4,5:9,10-diseco-3-hydroxy-5,9,17-trioxoandrosta-1(10),2-diene-4-oate hydrolase
VAHGAEPRFIPFIGGRAFFSAMSSSALLRSVLVLSVTSCASEHLSAAQRFPDPPRRLALAVAEPRTLVEVDGVSLAIHDSDPQGEKPAIVCLHAIGHGGSDFAGFESAFASRYRVITVDWPGHGASGADTQPASTARYGALLEGLIDRLHLDHLILLGNSVGGGAAVRFAAAHPERVRALILCNPSGFDPGGWFARFFIGRLEAHFAEGAEGLARFGPWFRDYYAEVLVTPEAEARRRLIVDAGYEMAPVLREAWHSFAQPEADQRALAPKLTMPVFVAWASRDGAVRWGRNRAAIETIPHVQVQMFDAGHAPFLEAPQAFNAAVTTFLDGVEAGRR